MNKTKVMVSALNQDPSFQSIKHFCEMRFKGVGVSSILCTLCNHWVEKRCSGLKSKLASTISFKCKERLDPQVSDVDYEAVELNKSKYDVVIQFFYLGDMITAGG